MFGFVRVSKLMKIFDELKDSMNTGKTTDVSDYNWKCGNANAVNFIIYRLGLKSGDKKNG